jgi:RND family efflux transporter MFP subunit
MNGGRTAKKDRMTPTRSSAVFSRLAALLLASALPVWSDTGLPHVTVRADAQGTSAAFDGVVEAVRQTLIAAQVAGAVVQLDAKVGDRVKAGQLLLRIDARAADQNAAASQAQVMAARASLDVAAKELARQKQLFQSQFISQAALDRTEAEFKATQAQVNAQVAQAGAASTQTGLHLVRAPYAGVVADVPVALGDMAMPGRPLITLYDPSQLRVSASVPQSVALSTAAGQALRVELPGLPAASQWPAPSRVQVLPTVDASTHTVLLRAELPSGLSGIAPGMFARLWAPLGGAGNGAPAATLSVPRQAIVKRAEMTGLYVLDAKDQPMLRQVRVGRSDGERIEILTGLMPGERVVTDPQRAARARPGQP